MLAKIEDIDEHITNMSSYKLSFFEKLILSRGLDFSLPQKAGPFEIKAAFEKLYWRIEPKLEKDTKELTSVTLKSIALNYIKHKNSTPPKALLKAVNRLKKMDDIIITRPDKGSGVVIMNRDTYVSLLKKASIDDNSKFIPISLEQPKKRGRPIKHYHPLLEKEKQLNKLVKDILPDEVAKTVLAKGSNLAHLYGLPKTHKPQLSMRPILSAVGTYNYNLAKWLDEKLKPLSINSHTISNIFQFAEDLAKSNANENDILVSYDVTALFTNVPVEETIELLTVKAFENNWFNNAHNLNVTRTELKQLLEIAAKNQLFQFDGQLYEQRDGVAMGSPLGPLMANSFLCNIEESLDSTNKLPAFYKRYVDDTLTFVENTDDAESFLRVLNEAHPSLVFTMETAVDNSLPFLGMLISKRGCNLQTKVYRKPTDKGLLLHFYSHVDSRYKKALLNTMLYRGFRLSSSWELFAEEIDRLKEIFSKLQYPMSLFHSTVQSFMQQQQQQQQPQDNSTTNNKSSDDVNAIRFSIPFKDQKSCDSVKKQLRDLSNKVNLKIEPVFTSRKLSANFGLKEDKHPLVNRQNVVYAFKCDLCEAGYVGYTCRHLYQRVEEHKSSAVGVHYKRCHQDNRDFEKNFTVLKQCKTKFDCLVHEMLFIQHLKPSINVQSDSLRAKIFN